MNIFLKLVMLKKTITDRLVAKKAIILSLKGQVSLAYPAIPLYQWPFF